MSERIFSFALPVSVSGTDDRGRLFSEKTLIASINAFEARFGLKSRVPVGAALRLAMDVPGTRFLGPPLKLLLAGEVVSRPRRKDTATRRTIHIKLYGRYRLQPQEPETGPEPDRSEASD